MHTISLLTCIFYFRKYLFTVLICSPPACQWPRPDVSEDLLFHLGYHFRSVVGWLGWPLQKPLPGRESGVHARALLTFGISRSPVGSCLDCMAREATLPTRMYLANRSRSLIFNRYSTRGACRRHVLTLVNSKPRTLRKQRTHVLLPQVFNCNWHNLHWDCIIHPAVLPPCAFFMKRPMYNIIT